MHVYPSWIADRTAGWTSGAALVAVALLAVSALALGVAPAFMPPGYDWIAQTTSESGAQALAGAWVARLGFLTSGLAVLWLCVVARDTWSPGATWLHAGFGVLMTAAAAFSHRPWLNGVAFDPMEDALHSFAASAMGFAFIFGVVLRLMQRRRQHNPGWAWDIVAILASTIVPMAMTAVPEQDGLMQRAMFLVAYIWYAREALDAGSAIT